MPCISSSCQLSLGRISCTLLNTSSKSGILVLFHPRGNISVVQYNIVGFSYTFFIMLRYFLLFLVSWVLLLCKTVGFCQILFSESVVMIIFFSYVHVIYYIDRFLCIEPPFHFGINSNRAWYIFLLKMLMVLVW